jgi:hypothetical protein
MWDRFLSPVIFPLEGGDNIFIRKVHNSLPSNGEGGSEGLNPHTNLVKRKRM